MLFNVADKDSQTIDRRCKSGGAGDERNESIFGHPSPSPSNRSFALLHLDTKCIACT